MSTLHPDQDTANLRPTTVDDLARECQALREQRDALAKGFEALQGAFEASVARYDQLRVVLADVFQQLRRQLGLDTTQAGGVEWRGVDDQSEHSKQS